VQEALGADHGGELGLEDLECDAPVMADVLGQIDRRHAAGPELALEQVALPEGVGQGGALHVGHGRGLWREWCNVPSLAEERQHGLGVGPYRTRTTTGRIHPGSSVFTSSLRSPRVRG